MRRQLETIRSFADNTFSGKITISEADEKRSNLLKTSLEVNSRARSKTEEDKNKKKDTYESIKV